MKKETKLGVTSVCEEIDLNLAVFFNIGLKMYKGTWKRDKLSFCGIGIKRWSPVITKMVLA